jgi:glycosyltransferase involved in cell wall biosynthesis
MNFPKISIITPSLNQSKYLEETIVSVINQNYPSLEYIIIDGGSTDGSVDIIRKYERSLHFWISEKDAGQTDAINKGMKKSSGEIVNWLNSDDYYEENTLFAIADAFADDKISCVTGRSRKFDSVNTLHFSKGTTIFPSNLEKTIGWARVDQPETFFRMSSIRDIIPMSTELKYLMDRELWMNYLLLNGLDGIKSIDRTLVNFRMHDESKTTTQIKYFQAEHDTLFYNLADAYSSLKQKAIIEQFFVIEKSLSLQKPPLHHDKKFIEGVLNYYLLLRACEFYEQNNGDAARNIFKAVKEDMLSAEDRTLYHKLRFRNKYIPVFILNMIRRQFRK